MHFFYFKSLKIHYNLKVDFFPKSMRRLYGFGDVLLTHPSESGVLLIKHKPQAHPWLYLWYNSKILWWSISLSCIDLSVLKNRLNFHCRLDSDSSTCCIWHLNLSTKKWWVHYCSWKWWIVLCIFFKELFSWLSWRTCFKNNRLWILSARRRSCPCSYLKKWLIAQLLWPLHWWSSNWRKLLCFRLPSKASIY